MQMPEDTSKTIYTRRILARADQPKAGAPELDWINSEVRLLGKSFGRAARSIEEEIACGSMIVIRTETTSRRPYRDEREILEFLGDNCIFTTREIAFQVNGHGDMRRWSQLTRQVLLTMRREGWIEPIDSDKPVVWRRTAAGTEALQR